MWAAQAPQSICGYGGMADMFKVRPCLTTVQCTMYIQAAKKSSFPQNTRKAGNEQSCTVLVC